MYATGGARKNLGVRVDSEFTYQRVMETVTPIFDKEMGRRLKFMRMALFLDQAQLGEKLGVTQQMIAKLELGQTKVSRVPIPLIRFYLVFGCATHHILFGSDAKQFNYEQINRKYWIEKDRRKGNRTGNRDTYANRRKLRRRYVD